MLCGGVGGARAALALYENLPPDSLTFVVNSGDDFEHLGLRIWPDWDTVVYHLADLQDSERGWGRRDEGIRAMEEFQRFGADDWFHLGDRDLALHVYRTSELQEKSGAQVAQAIRQALGIGSEVLPATRDSLRTRLILEDGQPMDFQEWFVQHRCGPRVHSVEQAGLSHATLTPGVEEALANCELLLYAPSNPYLSLQPMLRVPKLAKLLRELKCPRWAISPLIGGRALKGPLDQLIESLSEHEGQAMVLDFYRDWADRVLMPAAEVPASHPRAVGCHTLLKDAANRKKFVGELMSLWP